MEHSAPGDTDAERAAWLADKIGAQGDYAKEAAAMLRRWPAGVTVGSCTYPDCACVPNGDVGCNSPNAVARGLPGGPQA